MPNADPGDGLHDVPAVSGRSLLIDGMLGPSGTRSPGPRVPCTRVHILGGTAWRWCMAQD